MSYRHEGSPAFTIEFPVGTREVAPDGPNQIFAASTPDGVTFQASITDFPAGILLPIEKVAEYFVQLTTAAGTGSDFAVTRNEEITLSDGSPAYRSEVTWLYIPAAVSLGDADRVRVQGRPAGLHHGTPEAEHGAHLEARGEPAVPVGAALVAARAGFVH